MKSRRLKLHFWQELIFFILVTVVPVIIAGCEVFSSHSSIFKITFSSIGSILLIIIITRKFILHNYIKKLQNECIALEHDYSINVGDENLCKHRWAICNIIIYAYNAIVTILSVILAVLVVNALYDQLLQFKGAALIILCSTIIGLLWKLICYLSMLRIYKENNNVKN